MKNKARLTVLALAGALVLAGTAYAHADYARSEPGAGSVVSAPPERVEIWFTQDMFRRAGENWIRVVGADGAEVQAGEAEIDDDDRRRLTVAVQPDVPPGEYTVTWRTLSAEDGDDEEGSFTFTLDPQAQLTSTPMSAAPTPTDLAPPPTRTPPALAATSTPAPTNGCGAALLPIVGLVAVWRTARRRRPQ